MNWTLLVPGALLPPRLAPELARALDLPVLAAHLAAARGSEPEPRTPPQQGSSLQPVLSAHWAWLARQFGVDPETTPTAPYAWYGSRGGAPEARPTAAPEPAWIAFCEPVHLAIARDHFVVSDLGDAPLQAAEADELLDRANAVLARESAAPGRADPGHAKPGLANPDQAHAARADSRQSAPLRLVQHEGTWFLLSPVPWDIHAWSLDAVLGQSVQDRLPTGPDARRWRVLANEIQMSWHASTSADTRESAGQRPANALWLHGGGTWHPLPALADRQLRLEGAKAESSTVNGWRRAAGAPPKPASAMDARGAAQTDTLAICRDLFGPHAHQAWETWIGRWPAVEARIAAEWGEARQAGASRFDLVLSGSHATRTISLPLQASWWHRWRRPPPPAQLLQRWLTEPTADTSPGGAAPGAKAHAVTA